MTSVRVRWAGALTVIAVMAAAFNLRPAVVSIGPLLDDIRATTGLSGLGAGVLIGIALSGTAFGVIYAAVGRLVPDARRPWAIGMAGAIGGLGQFLMVPVEGWLIAGLGWQQALIALSMVVIAVWVPGWHAPRPGGASADAGADAAANVPAGYAVVWRHPYFQRLAPLGFFVYGGMVAVQTLWAGPWMQQVAGYTPLAAATGLFWINVSMLCTFWSWGMLNPWLLRKGFGADWLMAVGLPLSLVVLLGIVLAGPAAGAGAWALFCVSCTFVSLSQPAVAMAFPQALAGRALSAYNLVIFAGVFVVQWGIGLAVDAFSAAGLSTVSAFRSAMAVFLACNAGAYAWFLWRGQRHNVPQTLAP